MAIKRYKPEQIADVTTCFNGKDYFTMTVRFVGGAGPDCV